MTTNIFQRLRELLPLPSVLVGTVLEHHDDDTSTVQIPSNAPLTGYAANVATGALIRPRGTTVPVGKKAFVRSGVIETQAPDEEAVDLPVGEVALIPKPPPPPPSLVTVFLENFNGAAGTLIGHVPDISPSPSVWVSSGSGIASAINGAGAINPTGNNSGTSNETMSKCIPAVAYNTSLGYSLKVIFANYDTVQTALARGSKVSLFSNFSDLLIIDKSAANGYIVRANSLFTHVPVSVGEHSAELVVTPTGAATLYVDGVLKQTVLNSGLFAATVPGIFTMQWTGGTAAQHEISFIELKVMSA